MKKDGTKLLDLAKLIGLTDESCDRHDVIKRWEINKKHFGENKIEFKKYPSQVKDI